MMEFAMNKHSQAIKSFQDGWPALGGVVCMVLFTHTEWVFKLKNSLKQRNDFISAKSLKALWNVLFFPSFPLR